MSSDGSSVGEGAAETAARMLRPVADALDGLGIAVCLFDEADATLLWNRSFLRFFPEHAAGVHVGEPYVANLRRFYEGRLDAREMLSIDRYIQEGVARHHAQQRPYVFQHGGRRLTVSSLPLPGVGRIRIWKEEASVLGEADAVDAPVITGFGGVSSAPEVDGTALFDHVADGVMVTSASGRVLWVNEPFVAMYGLADRQAARGLVFEEAYRRAWGDVQPDARALFEEGLATLSENMRFAGAPFEVPLPGSRWSRVIAQQSPDGKGFYAHVDITVLKRQQQQLLQAERRARESEALLRQKSAVLEATLERMEQGIMMVSAELVVEVCNHRAMELLGLPESLMTARPTFQEVLSYQWQTAEFSHTPKELLAFIEAGGILDTQQRYERERPDGRVIEVSSVPIEGGGVVRTYTDITERRRSEQRIRHLARHDGLTSLMNREVFLEHLSAAANACHSGQGAPFAVHYIDIDNFKPINDRYGHAVGDKVLVMAAERLRAVAGAQDVVARLGGDEFAVLQHDTGEPAAAHALASRILAAWGETMAVETQALRLKASIGIALHRSADDAPDRLMRHADSAMYAAKALGLGGIRIHGGNAPVEGMGAP